MTTRPLLVSFGLLALAACAAPVPDSGQGVGFGDYTSYAAQSLPAPAPVAATPLPPGGIPTTDLAAAGIGVPATTAPMGAPLGSPLTAGGVTVADPMRTAGVQASPSNAIPPGMAQNAISDEQDFGAVATRESIESDAARRAQQAAQYQVVQPTALPAAPANTGPNIVEYALNAPNRKGQPWYSRFIWAGARYDRNCATYRSADEAQQAFLEAGGPERDSLGIDPDGDGFACAWDPAPFLAAVGRF